MAKRRLTEYSGQIVILLCVVLLYLRFFWVAAIVYLLWYTLYGFVGLAFFFSTRRKLTISNLLLRITFSPTLLPFRKSFYFWTESANIILKSPSDTAKAFDLAKKVDVEGLGTDKNKAIFLSFLAALHNDMGDKDKALECIQQAKETAHQEALKEHISHVYDEITK
jgi:hypothetical protein